MASASSWTNQTLGVLASGRHLARRARQVEAGGFSLAYWTDNGSQPKGPHGHEDAHFMLVTSGAYETVARPGEAPSQSLLIFNPAGTYHDDHLIGGGAFFTITMQAFDARLPQYPTQIASPHARMLARRALRELGSEDAEALCWELTGLMSDERTPRHPPPWLTRACDHLRDNCAASVDLGALSRVLGIHPVHLTRTFRAFLHCTPGDYLRAWRLDRAAGALTVGKRSLAEIAVQTGFTDQSHLTRHFRRAYGVTPGAYRALTRGN
jgi:AraC family transcriptional regulator